ncbi:MAG TPA: hypothetical protein VM925_20245 [Labilithrix sp.]|nr:hypothetical protein [Labilithrix sp.]
MLTRSVLGNFRSSTSGASVLLVLAAALAGCSADANEGSAANEVNAGSGESISAVESRDDLGSMIRIKGRVGMSEGHTTIALFNRSQPTRRGILHDVTGGEMGISSFEAELGLGDPLVAGSMFAEPGDCVSVANVGTGGRGGRATEEEASAKREFGAFAYAFQSGGRTWQIDGAKVYATVDECLQDPARKATESAESLSSFEVTSDLGHMIRLKGRVSMFEGQTKFALVNRSKPAKEALLHDVTGGEMGYSLFTTELSLGDPLVPESMLAEPGDCVSVANVGAGGGGDGTVSKEAAKAEKPFGVFLYAYQGVSGAWAPAWASESPTVYETVEACLSAASRNP